MIPFASTNHLSLQSSKFLHRKLILLRRPGIEPGAPEWNLRCYHYTSGAGGPGQVRSPSLGQSVYSDSEHAVFDSVLVWELSKAE